MLGGELPANALVSDRELCERYTLSRTPVREAVLRLRDERLVEIVPRRGVRVLPLLAEDVREIHQVVRALEREAALAVAATGPTRANLADIERAVAAMEGAVAAGERERWAVADACFHAGIVAASGNERLAGIYHSLRGVTDRARHFALHLRELPLASTREHRAMLEAVLDGDGGAIDRLYRDHWERTTAEIVELLERHARPVPADALR